MTITIEIPDARAEQLSKEARRLELTIEQFAAQALEERLAGRRKYITQAIQRIIKEDEELYRRLA